VRLRLEYGSSLIFENNNPKPKQQEIPVVAVSYGIPQRDGGVKTDFAPSADASTAEYQDHGI